MSNASSDLQPRPALPAGPADDRPRGVRRPGRSGGRGPTADGPSDDHPCYPLDPPLVDVRIPVKEPHADATAYSRSALRHRFPGAQVGDDLHMLFSEPSAAEREWAPLARKGLGKAKQSRLSPDVFVALKVPRPGTRADYDADRLGPPDFVLEVLSRSTWKHDLGRKLDCYQQIGVRECLLFNATGKGLPEVDKELWGYSLTPERREPLEDVLLPNGERGVRSKVLALVAYVAERRPPSGPGETWALTMRWHDPVTAADIPDYEQARAGEAQARAEAEAERAKAEAGRARAEAAQRRIAELEDQLRRLRDVP